MDVVDLDQNFADLGVDSLMAMEIRNRCQSIIGEMSLTMNAMQENRTIRSLSVHITGLMEQVKVDWDEKLEFGRCNRSELQRNTILMSNKLF